MDQTVNKQYDLLHSLLTSNPHDILLHVDFDDCLGPTTVRDLTEEQKEILWDLHKLTNGGVIITTNSDGRSVFEMDGMHGFPVISEFGTVFRNIPGNLTSKPTEADRHDNQVEYLHDRPDCKKAFIAATEKVANINAKRRLNCENEIIVTNSARILNGNTPVIKFEEKEMGLAFVFGKHALLREDAYEIAQYAFKKAGLDENKFEIEIGADAVEIKVKGAAKDDVVVHMQDHPLYQRKLKAAMGDSGSDLAVMKKLGNGIAVGNRIQYDDLAYLNGFRIESDYKNFDDSWTFLKKLRDVYKKQPIAAAVVTQRTASGPR